MGEDGTDHDGQAVHADHPMAQLFAVFLVRVTIPVRSVVVVARGELEGFTRVTHVVPCRSTHCDGRAHVDYER